MYSVFLFVLITITGYGKSAVLRKNTTSELKVPESLLMKLRYIENASEFMSQFIASGRSYGVFLAYLEDGRSKAIPSEAVETPNHNDSNLPLAKNANCMPEQHLIELPRPTDPAVIIWPMCTRVKRCGGCCHSERLKCQPTVTSVVNVRTIAARYSEPGSQKFDFHGYENVQLVQHDNCRCLCREKAEDCSSLQVYSTDDCLCRCKNADSSSKCMGPNHHWDPTECSCKCNTYDDCSTGFFFNPQICRCESVRGPFQGISSSEVIGIRPIYKDDGGENDYYHSRHRGIRPLEDNAHPFAMSLHQADRKWHRITANDTPYN